MKRWIKKAINGFLRVIDYNLFYEKVIYWLSRLNKTGSFGGIISIILNLFLRLIYSCDVSPYAHIGKNVKIPHAVGIVIGGTAVIGDNSIIMPNVVIGAKNYPPDKNTSKRHATIGKRCMIGANSVIIGSINIGNDCIIGAGARVTKDIPDNTKLIIE